MMIVGNTFSSVYRDAARNLLKHGEKITVRGLTTIELTNVQLQLYSPRNRFVNFKSRDMSMKYFVGELCYFLAGRTDLASISYYSKFWEKVSDDGVTVNSSYGARLFTLMRQDQIQFKYAIRCLEKDPYSRKAIMLIYRPEDARESKDNPCTIFLSLIIRNEKLDAYAYMRSNDIWRGATYDIPFFTLVQEIAYTILLKTYPRLKLGTYFHNAISFHAYSDNLKDLIALSREGDHVEVIAPLLTSVDVDSWFDDLLTYEKFKRGKVLYKGESKTTRFQDWCKRYLK